MTEVVSSSHPQEAVPPVDAATLDGYRAFDDELLPMLIEQFFQESPQRMQALRAACAAGDVGTLKFEAHALKGSARVFGAACLVELCAALEQTHVVDESTRSRWNGLEAEFERVRAALERALEARKP